MLKKKKKSYLKIKPGVFSQSYWFAKFVNKLMQRGRKTAVENIVLNVFKKIKIQYHKDALKVLFFALVKNRPILGFVPIRISREVKKIPFPLAPRRQLIISLTWFIIALKLMRYRSKNISIEDVLYTQFKAVLRKEKNLLTNRRINHIKELIENRVNLNFRTKLKK